MKTINLVRHGIYANPASLEHPQGVLPLRSEGFPLSSAGETEVRKATAWLMQAKPAIIAASPRLRAIQTAQIIADQLHFKEAVGIIPELDEVDSPPFQGTDLETFVGFINAGKNIYTHPDHIAQGGESIDAMAQRMSIAIAGVLKQLTLKGANEAVLVSHGDPIAAVLARLANRVLDPGKYLPYPPTSGIIRLRFSDEFSFSRYTTLNFPDRLGAEV